MGKVKDSTSSNLSKANRIKARLAMLGITNERLAVSVGIAPSYLSMIIHGERTATKYRVKIAKKLGSTVEELWG